MVIRDTRRVVSSTQVGPYYTVAMILICFAGIMIRAHRARVINPRFNLPGNRENAYLGRALVGRDVGAILAPTGIAAEFWIRYRYLGRFWSGSVELQENHQVIESGLYQIIRRCMPSI